MNFDILRDLLKNNLADLSVNKYFSSYGGTMRIAQYYARNFDGCSTKVEGNKVDLYYKKKWIGAISGQTPSTNTKDAYHISSDKMKTEIYLSRAAISTTSSIQLNEKDKNKARETIESAETPKVIKPLNLNGAKGITLNVTSENFDFAWDSAVNATKKQKKKPEILIQDMVDGVEIRAMVVEGIFNSAVLRVPAHIIGDGSKTVEELVAEKNNLRNDNPHLNIRPIQLNDMALYNIKSAGHQLDSIPDYKEFVFIHHTSNISMGGDTYEVSHLVNESFKTLAEKAVSTIPGLNTSGVDIMVKSFDDMNPVILEVNSSANLRLHHFPFKGTPKAPIYNYIFALVHKHS